MIPDIGNINTNNSGIPRVGIGNIFINNSKIPNLMFRDIAETRNIRVWMREPPQAIPPTVPVTTFVGTPIVNIPGCVKVHKENSKRDPSRNKSLVNDDPKQTTTLCDAGAPYYEPPNYDARQLTWQTIYGEPQEEFKGLNTGEPPAPITPETPEPPQTPPQTAEDIPCPPPNARRIGDLNQAGTERVKGYELVQEGTICETVWEPIPFVDKYLPSAQVVTMTAGIAVVATSSALLAKPLADLLLKIVKPVVKKVIGKVNSLLGKKEPVLSLRERMLAQRERNRAIMELRKALKK